MLRTPAQPLDASNRRISVIVQNLEPTAARARENRRQACNQRSSKRSSQKGLIARVTNPVTVLRTLIRYNSRFVPYPIQEETTP
jgi:hypothetical protein